MYFDNDLSFTKHGYFLVNGTNKTLSKYEAWQLSNKNLENVEFIYNDDYTSTFDWSKEPKEDIYELYAARAKQLRKDYDYLVLMYSGGIDSHVALKSFLDNDIHLDEICTFGNELISKTEKINQEVFNTAIPYINSLDLDSIGTKFRYVGIGQMLIDQFSDEDHFENYHYYSISHPQWGAVTRSHLFKSSIEEHINLTKSGKKVCYIWGFDKPYIRSIDGNYCYQYNDNAIDLAARQYNNRVVLKDKFDNFYDEAFYISREFPEIVIKQSHLLVNHMKTLTSESSELRDYSELTNTGPFIEFKNLRFLDKLSIDRIIYPKEDLSMFGNDKLKGSFIFTKRDSWFNDSNHPNRNKFFNKTMDMVKNNRNLYYYSKEVGVIGAQALFSKPYIISKEKS